MNIEFSLQIVEKYSNINFHVLSSNESRDVPGGQTGRHDEAIVPFSIFVNVSKTGDYEEELHI